MSDACPGAGRCHGCAKWCDECGDVDRTCDAMVCHQHRCARCGVLLSDDEHEFENDWRKWCFGCEVAAAMDLAMRDGQVNELEVAARVEHEIAAFFKDRSI